MDHVVTAVTTQLCCCRTKGAIDNNEPRLGPATPHRKQRVGWIGLTGHGQGLPTSAIYIISYMYQILVGGIGSSED